MQVDGSAYLYTKEGRNGYNNGLYTLLDDLCAYWGWEKSKITVDTSNAAATHPEYTVVYTDFSDSLAKAEMNPDVLPWNKEKYYGLFIGTANASRIRAIHNHNRFPYKEHGLTSFNQDLHQYMIYSELIEYFFHSGQTYEEMISIKPYSDIANIVDTPENNKTIVPPYNCETHWNKVYEKIAVEIVCETSTGPDCTDISEKTFRPLYYKRPFLIIGSPGQLKYLQDVGFKTFNTVLDENYDKLIGMHRVDRVFDILHNLIETQSIDTILDRCEDILEHNHQLVIKKCYQHKFVSYKRIIDEK
jgi:hypothetical protein